MKNIIKWIKENVFRIKPIFKIEIKESWFSEKYVYIRYTNDNGFHWYVIPEAVSDYDVAWNKRKIECKYISIDDIESFIKYNDFKTFEDCEKYSSEVYAEVDKHNEIAYKRYKESMETGKRFIKQYNKTEFNKM